MKRLLRRTGKISRLQSMCCARNKVSKQLVSSPISGEARHPQGQIATVATLSNAGNADTCFRRQTRARWEGNELLASSDRGIRGGHAGLPVVLLKGDQSERACTDRAPTLA